MGTFILLIIIVSLAIFIFRNFLSVPWNDDAKAKFETIRKERLFWNLVKDKKTSWGVDSIFTIYLSPDHFAPLLLYRSPRTETDKEILKLIRKGKDFANINALNRALEERDASIKKTLGHALRLISKSDVREAFDLHGEERGVPTQYRKFVYMYLDHLTVNDSKCLEVWEARKKFEENTAQLEWKNEDEKVEPLKLFDVKKSQEAVGRVIAKLLSERFAVEVQIDTIPDCTDSLIKDLEQWEQLQMIQWCILDYSVGWLNTNGVQRLMWKALGEFAA